MRHASKYAIDPNHIEVVRIFYKAGDTLQPYFRYSFPFNDFLSRGRVKHIRLHTWDITDNFPVTYNFNGNAYDNIVALLMPNFLITIADRRGGYFCQDMPLGNFLQGAASGHYIKKLDLEIDNENSFIWWTGPIVNVVPPGLAIIFYMDMYGKLNDNYN